MIKFNLRGDKSRGRSLRGEILKDLEREREIVVNRSELKVLVREALKLKKDLIGHASNSLYTVPTGFTYTKVEES